MNGRFGPQARLDLALVVLTAVLVLATLYFIIQPSVSFVIENSRLDLVIEVTAALVAGGVAALAWIRFGEKGEPGALLLAGGFLALSLASAFVSVVLVARLEVPFGMASSAAGQAPLYGWLASGLVSGGFFLLAGVATWRRWTDIRVPGLVLLLPTLVALVLWGAAELAEPFLPRLLEAEGVRQLAEDPLVHGVLPGMSPVLVGAQSAIAIMFAVAALSYREISRRDAKASAAYLAAGFVIAAFSNLHFSLYPAGYSSLITIADWLRVAFYVVLLFVVGAEARADLASVRQANVDLSRLRDDEVARAALEERARLAREVHDGLAQDLWFAKLKHARLLAQGRLTGEDRVLAEEVSGAIDSALADARQAVFVNRFDPGEPGGSFADALASFLDDFADRYGLQAEFTLEAVPPVPPKAQAEVLRIVQEALNNVRKHADATTVRVHISTTRGGRFVIEVGDNGRGFEHDGQGRGVGLRIMRERAELIGGTFRLESTSGGGTRVFVELPAGPAVTDPAAADVA